MRSLWAGLLLLLLSASGAWGQATGQVRELGFGGYYRADCWTGLLVHLDSTISQPAEYQIQVHQQDLDQDTVVFTRTVTLGPQAHEDFWVYFLPQPTNGGLRGGSANAQLGDVLKVHLYDKKGKTHIAPLPVQARADEVEQSAGGGQGDRACKLVLVVYGEQANVHADEYAGAEGTSETIRFVPVRPEALPDHLLGYQAVDAVLWLNADWNRVRSAPAFSALQQWVRRGGQLALCQPNDRSQLEPLADADMLPVVARTGSGPTAAWAIRARQKRGVDHLDQIALNAGGIVVPPAAWKALADSGRTFEVAHATARPDAVVDAWVTWETEPDTAAVSGPATAPATGPARPPERTPFIARRAYGMGAVTWVAQNLAAADLASAPNPAYRKGVDDPARRTIPTNGWPRIWDRVFGWQNRTRTEAEIRGTDDRFIDEKRAYAPGTAVDLGAGVAKAMEHASRSAAYVFVACLFFIAYWVVAGPGSYLYLAARKRKGMSWGAFAVTAVGAAVLTVLVVKLLLGGGAEVRHVSVVRLSPGTAAADGSPRFAADVTSRVGVYVPKDGGQRVSLPAAGPERVAAVAPYAIPPNWLKRETDAGFTDTARYTVDTDPVLAGQAPSADFFFRSTLKKVQAQWSGQVAEGVVGSAELVPDLPSSPITGVLTNRTGRDLKDVFFVFAYGPPDAVAERQRANDRVLYLPEWKNGIAVDLSVEFTSMTPQINSQSPGYGQKVAGSIEPVVGTGWTGWWYIDLPTSFGSDVYDDKRDGYRHAFPLMSLVDRVGPAKRKSSNDSRPEPVRRGFRDMDVSPLVAAGRLVVLAHAPASPVPLPLAVNEVPVTGEGVTFYQIAVPLGREKYRAPPPPAATQKAVGGGQKPE